MDLDAAAALAEDARRQAELARAYDRYQGLIPSNGSLDFGDQVSLTLGCCASPHGREKLQRAIQIHPRGRIPRHQPLPSGARRLVAGPPERDGRGRRRPVDLPVPGRRHHQHPQFPARYRRLPSSCCARTTAPTPILDASYRLIRHNHPDRLESRAGIVKRLDPQRDGDDAVPVRHEAFARRRRGGGLDRVGHRPPGPRGAPGHATWPCSSARTPRQTRSCAR